MRNSKVQNAGTPDQNAENTDQTIRAFLDGPEMNIEIQAAPRNLPGDGPTVHVPTVHIPTVHIPTVHIPTVHIPTVDVLDPIDAPRSPTVRIIYDY